jgi:hypothetical protein
MTLVRGCLLAVLALPACGSGARDSLLGGWSGQWASNGGSTGDVQTNFTADDGRRFDGSIQFSGSPCFSGAAITGELVGDDITGTITAAGIRIDYTATLQAELMSGSYNAVFAGDCTGDSGTFSLDKR